METVSGRARTRQASGTTTSRTPLPGQIELDLDVARVVRAKRPRAARATAVTAELDLGPLVRRARHRPGPKWPPFRFAYEDLTAAAEEASR